MSEGKTLWTDVLDPTEVIVGQNIKAVARLKQEHTEMAERLSARARLMGLAWIKLAPADDAMAAALREAATDDLALLHRLEEGQ
jgi:hypothetical protein